MKTTRAKVFFLAFKLLLIISIVTSCSSDDDSCTKTIQVAQPNPSGNPTYNTIEVPCDFEPEGISVAEPNLLEEFDYNVINFLFIPDTENDTRIFEIEVELFNNSNVDVSGAPFFILNFDGQESRINYNSIATQTCTQIEANSSCVFLLEIEEPTAIHPIDNIELIDIEYQLQE